MIEKKITEGLEELGGINQYIKKNDRVLLKPNLLIIKNPGSAVLTHPEFILAVIRIVKKQGASCWVGDSPSIISARQVAAFSGIMKICRQEDVPIIDLKTPVEIKTPYGKIARSLTVAKEIFDFDKIINLPKLKNHTLTTITAAVKNLYGVIPGFEKGKYHFRFKNAEEFSTLLVELNHLVRPCLNIVDGIVAMEGDGPMAGDPKKTGLIIMGDDAIAVDYTAAMIMSYRPDEIPFIKIAKEYKFGGYELNLIQVRGEDLKKSIIKDFKKIKAQKSPGMFPGFIRIVINNFIIKKPVISKDICIGCANCIKICPAKTIILTEKKAVISYNKCIKCYCCSEVCPQKAVRLKIRPFSF